MCEGLRLPPGTCLCEMYQGGEIRGAARSCPWALAVFTIAEDGAGSAVDFKTS